MEHPWITGDQEEAGPRTTTNLAHIVRRGFDSRNTFKSVVTAMTLLNHWKNLEDLSEDEDDSNESDEESLRKLDVRHQ